MTIECQCGCRRKRTALGAKGQVVRFIKGHGGLTAGKRPDYKPTPKGTTV